MKKVKLINDAMSELKQFGTYGKDQNKEVVINHLMYSFRLEADEAEAVYNHMNALLS